MRATINERYCDCGKWVSVLANGKSARHNDEATGIPCDGFWLCSQCGRNWAGYNIPNECECGKRPAKSVLA